MDLPTTMFAAVTISIKNAYSEVFHGAVFSLEDGRTTKTCSGHFK
jgi:hypothetical protein